MKKSIIIDEDIHHYLKLVSATYNRHIKFLVAESIIDLCKKYKIETPTNLQKYYTNENISS